MKLYVLEVKLCETFVRLCKGRYFGQNKPLALEALAWPRAPRAEV